MTLHTLVRFLLLRKDAIETVARSQGALLLGVLFVFGAALAREYDRSDLAAEPIHLFLPLLASLASSFLLWGLLWNINYSKRLPWNCPSYADFLRCFWMTAPLAWIYAIPVERFLDEGNAVEANFWMLGIVALWRVVVIIRVIQVLWSVPTWIAAAIVLTYSDAVIIAANLFSPWPIFDIMSGNRLSAAESRLIGARLLIGAVSFLAAPILLIMFTTACATAWPANERQTSRPERVKLPLWVLSIVLLIIGGWMLTIGQPAQQRATVMAHDIQAGRYREALEFQSSHVSGDFPPHWNPPPYPGYRNDDIVPLARLVAKIPELQVPDWVRDFWSRRLLRNFNAGYLVDQVWQHLSVDEIGSMLSILERVPEDDRKSILRPHWLPNFDLGPHGRNWPLQQRFGALIGMTPAELATINQYPDDDATPADALQPESSKSAPQ